MLGACEIMKQIAHNEQDRLLQLEKMEQENTEARRKMAKDMLTEMDRRQKKREEQEMLREDLNFANSQMIEVRIKEKEQDRLFDLKILKEQQEKAASDRICFFLTQDFCSFLPGSDHYDDMNYASRTGSNFR